MLNLNSASEKLIFHELFINNPSILYEKQRRRNNHGKEKKHKT